MLKADLTFHAFPETQPPGGKELLLITTSKVFRKGDLYSGQWRTEGDHWSATQGAYVYVLRNLTDVIYWAELPDAVVLVNDARGVAPTASALPLKATAAMLLAADRVYERRLRECNYNMQDSGRSQMFYEAWSAMLAASGVETSDGGQHG